METNNKTAPIRPQCCLSGFDEPYENARYGSSLPRKASLYRDRGHDCRQFCLNAAGTRIGLPFRGCHRAPDISGRVSLQSLPRRNRLLYQPRPWPQPDRASRVAWFYTSGAESLHHRVVRNRQKLYSHSSWLSDLQRRDTNQLCRCIQADGST